MPLDAARDAVIVMQARVIEALAAENTRLAGQVADLAARVERLERQASRNSGNSSMPPSADDLPGRTPPRRKPSAGGKRKPGKQPGSPGSHLAWSEYLDDKVPHFPAGACECGADLAGAGDLGVAASHQQVEIPLVSAQVIQHDLHAVRCDDVLRFAGDLRIPPTSNDAERDLRPAKTQQKISGRLRSEQTTRQRYAIRGYLSTASKHGINKLSALRDALAGYPWMPPIPHPP